MTFFFKLNTMLTLNKPQNSSHLDIFYLQHYYLLVIYNISVPQIYYESQNANLKEETMTNIFLGLKMIIKSKPQVNFSGQ